MRILCLHGLANNNELMKSYMESVLSGFEDEDVSFEFYEGTFVAGEADSAYIPSKIKEKHKGKLRCYALYNSDIKCLTLLPEGLKLLIEFINETGPYEGLLGYS